MELVIFLLGTLLFVLLSHQALLHRHSRGFPRFFAFEAILCLVILNAPSWFVLPFSFRQLISWALLLASAFLVIFSVLVLRKFGMPDKSMSDASRIAFEKTTHLVTAGPYRFIRHPMYTSLHCLAMGIFLKHITLLSGLLMTVAILALYTTAIFEERENLRNFGEEYDAYMHHTRRFIPYVY